MKEIQSGDLGLETYPWICLTSWRIVIFQEICLAFKCLAAFKALEYQKTVKCPFKASENQRILENFTPLGRLKVSVSNIGLVLLLLLVIQQWFMLWFTELLSEKESLKLSINSSLAEDTNAEGIQLFLWGPIG